MPAALRPFHLRWRRHLRTLGWTLVLLALLVLLWGLNRPPLATGRMLYASDGDSLVMHLEGKHRAVRLIGIDAPERGQRCGNAAQQPWDCGSAATAALRTLVPRGSALTCQSSGRDRYDRMVSHCTLADGRDLGAALVVGGWAIATADEYLVEEAEARAARRGLWIGDFASPADWRATNPKK